MLTRPFVLLRLEGAVLFVLALVAYTHWGREWLLFALLFLAPDLFMLGYVRNPRVGAAIYNLGHTLTIPLVLLACGYWRHISMATALGLIWFAHIEFDRMLGYGLKSPLHFKQTHLTP
jgi:hypothetical protein